MKIIGYIYIYIICVVRYPILATVLYYFTDFLYSFLAYKLHVDLHYYDRLDA